MSKEKSTLSKSLGMVLLLFVSMLFFALTRPVDAYYIDHTTVPTTALAVSDLDDSVNGMTAYVDAVASLPNGKIALFINTYDAGWATYKSYVRVVTSSGATVYTTEITSQMGSRLNNVYRRYIYGLSSGNVVVTWEGTSSGCDNNTNNLFQFIIINSSGTISTPTTNVSQGTGPYNCYTGAAELSNGNIAFFYEWAGDAYNLRIFNTSGASVAGPLAIPKPAACGSTYSHSMAANNNGKIMLTSNCNGYNKYFGVLYNNDGTVSQVGGSNTFDISSVNKGGGAQSHVTSLSDNNFAVIYMGEPGADYTSRDLRRRIVQPNGTLGTEVIGPVMGLSPIGNIRGLKDGGFVRYRGDASKIAIADLYDNSGASLETDRYLDTTAGEPDFDVLDSGKEQGFLYWNYNDFLTVPTLYIMHLYNYVVQPPTVTDANISISGASGTGGAYKIGDTVTATWNNTAGGDNNSGITGVTVDFSQFGGGAAVAATNSSGTWTAIYTIASGAIDGTNKHVSVTATNGTPTTTADTTNAIVDNIAPTVTDTKISISGASGSGGAFKIGDTVTATWNNTAGGDNNSDTISSVTVDFSQFGGGVAVTATNSSGTWTATYIITTGAIDGANKNGSVTATDNAGNTTTTADTTNATLDNVAPTVTDARISISGASGTGGAFKIGDTVTSTWNNTAGGDNNSDTISGVTMDFSQFGGGSAVAASNSAGTWTATYTIVSGAIDGTNKNVSVTATDNAGNTRTTADTTNATVDNIAPTVTDGNISISGASGMGGAFKIGDTVTATWNNTAGGDNNSDAISGVTVDFNQFGGGAAVATTNSSGTWTSTYNIAAGAINSVTNRNVSVTATDNAGNTTTTADTTNATVDNVSPTINSVVPPASGTYSASQNLDFIVGFSEPVNVDITNGTPYMALTVGSKSVHADYQSGSGTNSLVFRYVVAANDCDADGIGLTIGLTLAGGTIKDIAGNPAFLIAGPAVVVNGVNVDAVLPTISISDPTATTTTSGPVDFTVTYSDTNFNTSTLASENITLNKTGTADAATISVGGSGSTRTVTLSDISGSGTLGINIASGTASDTAGNTAPAAGPSSTFIVCAGDAITVSDTGDSGPGSLRRAIADICPGGTIDFGVTGTIILTTGELVIDEDMTIAGPGAANLTVSGNDASRVFNVSSGTTVAIQGITIANGYEGTGGGIFNGGTLTVTDSVLSGNTAGNAGGGIFNTGSLEVTNSTISANGALFAGGGGILSSGTLTVTNSTIAGNTANSGCGIYIGPVGTATVTNVTIPGNSAIDGGGIWNDGIVDVTNSTLSDNSASANGGGIYKGSGTVTITNSIIANRLSGGNCYGTVTDGGNNIDDGATCGFSYPTSLSSTDPLLDPAGLQDNGGPTQTIALLSGSPAIDAGDDATCAPTDQRGIARPQGSHCDIGAYEDKPATVLSITRSSSSPIDASTVSWTITFADNVRNLSASNFSLINTGLSGTPAITDATGSGTTWTVTASTGNGNGTLQLNMVNDAGLIPSISDLPFEGEAYTLDLTDPAITDATSSTANGNYREGDTINIRLNFNEAVTSTGLTINLDSGGSIATGAFNKVTTLTRTYAVSPGENTSDLTVSGITGAMSDSVGTISTDPSIPAGNNIGDVKNIVIDTTGPVISAEGDRIKNAVFTQTAMATDANPMTYGWTKQTGPGAITFGSATTKSTTISADADGVYILRFTATDRAGNTSYDEMTLTWDTTAPITTATPSGGIYATAVAVELTCSDGTGSGCAKTVYCLGENCSTWKLYSGPIAFNGQRYLSYRSVDNAGNRETAVTNVSYTYCTYSVTPISMTTGSGATTRNFTVTTQDGCSWSAVSSDPWLITASTGTGSGTGSYSVETNAGPPSLERTGTITVGDKTITVTQRPVKPTAPEITSATAGATDVVLDWADNSDNEDGFRVYRRKSTETGWTEVGTKGAGATSHTDTAVANTTYSYMVTAYNSGGEASSSEEKVTTGGITPPELLTAEAQSATSAELFWRNFDNGEEGYEVWRIKKGEADWSKINTPALAARTAGYTDTTLTSNALYLYQVCATTTAGGSACSNEMMINGPSELTLTPTAGGVQLDWADNSSDESGFRVFRRESTEKTWRQLGTVSADAETYLDDTAAPDTTYQYKVAAYNSIGAKGSSSGKTTAGTLEPPDGLTAEKSPAGTQAYLSWRDNSTDETGYGLWRLRPGGTEWKMVKALGPDATVCKDGLLPAGNLYLYQICAVTAEGGSACSNVSGISGPTDVTASAAAGEVDLGWTDNSGNEKGFNIWRKTSDNIWRVIGRTGADITTYRDRTVGPGEYRYRICIQGLYLCGTSGTVTVP